VIVPSALSTKRGDDVKVQVSPLGHWTSNAHDCGVTEHVPDAAHAPHVPR